MEDKVPDLLEFGSMKTHDELSDPAENPLKLEDPPISETHTSSMFEHYQPNDNEKEISNDSPNEDLLNLNEPPNEESKEIDNLSNTAAEEFAQNFVNPIIQEAIEIQKAELEECLSDEAKVDSSGDKKSEKSCSDDGFELLKADDIHSSGNLDPNSEDFHQTLDSESYNKDIEDEPFLTEDMKIDNEDDLRTEDNNDDYKLEEDLQMEDNDDAYEKTPFIKDDESFLHEELSIISNPSDVQNSPHQQEEDTFDRFLHVEEPVAPSTLNFELEKEMDEMKEDEYEFDVQGIIKASNMSMLSTESSAIIDSPVTYGCKSNLIQKCKDVFCWKNPILSSVVLSAIMLIELGLMCDYSIISLLAYSGLLLLGSSFAYKIAVKFNLLKHCAQSECALSVSSEDIQSCVDCTLKWIEYLFNEVRSLTYVTSITKNLKAFTFFWILTYIGQWFNLLSLIFIGTIVSFALPIIYITNEKAIDQALDNVRACVKESINKLKSKSQNLIGGRAR